MIEKVKIIEDTIEQYHAVNCISASGLKTIALNDNNVNCYLKKDFKKTASMELGVQVHTILQEGIKGFNKEYFVLPDLDMRLKQNKELVKQLVEKNDGKKSISNANYKICLEIYTNAKDNKNVMEYLDGMHEISHYGKYLGIDIRVRPDTIGKGWISDIKSCQDASPKEFQKAIKYLGYNIQATFYCDMLNFDPKNFRFIACMTKPPYSVQLYHMSEETIEWGRKGWREAFHYWKQYVDHGIISGYIGKEVESDGSIEI